MYTDLDKRLRLKTLRKKEELTIIDVASVLGISGPAYHNIETGKTQLSEKHCSKLAELYGVSPGYIMFGEETGPVQVKELKPSYGPVRYSQESVNRRFIEWLKEYKIRLNITQREIAEMWDVSESFLSDVMHGRKHVSIMLLGAAMHYGNMNMNYAIGGIGQPDIEPVKLPKNYTHKK